MIKSTAILNDKLSIGYQPKIHPLWPDETRVIGFSPKDFETYKPKIAKLVEEREGEYMEPENFNRVIASMFLEDYLESTTKTSKVLGFKYINRNPSCKFDVNGNECQFMEDEKRIKIKTENGYSQIDGLINVYDRYGKNHSLLIQSQVNPRSRSLKLKLDVARRFLDFPHVLSQLILVPQDRFEFCPDRYVRYINSHLSNLCLVYSNTTEDVRKLAKYAASLHTNPEQNKFLEASRKLSKRFEPRDYAMRIIENGFENIQKIHDQIIDLASSNDNLISSIPDESLPHLYRLLNHREEVEDRLIKDAQNLVKRVSGFFEEERLCSLSMLFDSIPVQKISPEVISKSIHGSHTFPGAYLRDLTRELAEQRERITEQTLTDTINKVIRDKSRLISNKSDYWKIKKMTFPGSFEFNSK
jgi:hypothetical protein